MIGLSRRTVFVPLIAFALALVSSDIVRAETWEQVSEMLEQCEDLINTGQEGEAEQVAAKAVAIAEEAFQDRQIRIALCLSKLGKVYKVQQRWDESEAQYKKAVAICRRAYGEVHQNTSGTLTDLGIMYKDARRYEDANRCFAEARDISTKLYGADHEEVAVAMSNCALSLAEQHRYDEATPLYEQALAIQERKLGRDHVAVAVTLHNLAGVFRDTDQLKRAEELYLRALAIREKDYGEDHPRVLLTMHNLADVYYRQGRYRQADQLYQRLVRLTEGRYGPDHPEVAIELNNLALVCRSLGQYGKAETLYKRAMRIYETAYGPDHLDVAWALNGLALIYDDQGRSAEALPLYERSLAIRERVLGPEHPSVAITLNNLACVLDDLGREDECEQLYLRALAIDEKVYGPDHSAVASQLNNLGLLYKSQGRYDEAAEYYGRCLEIRQRAQGPNHPDVAMVLHNLAYLANDRGDIDAAEAYIDRAIAIRERANISPSVRFDSYYLRAKIAWTDGRKSEALADMRRAMELAELQRSYSAGAERERAKLFANFSSAFERMVEWQGQEGDLAEVLAAMERGRARSLLDELGMAGSDVNVGRSLRERERLSRRESELKAEIARLENELNDLSGDSGEASDEQRRLQDLLAKAREALYEHYRDERSSSPVYRDLLTVGSGPPRLSQIRRRLVGEDGLMLVYMFGTDGGYVLAVRPDSAELHPLAVPEKEAEQLGIDQGPLTAARLKSALLNEDESGLIASLARPNTSAETITRLAALTRILLPERELNSILDGSVKRLVVVPDGPLALLPLETLVVDVTGPQTTYLLDVGPPVIYGPSATVLYNLAQRGDAPAESDNKRVLTVGDPLYGNQSADEADDEATSRFWISNRKLTPIPYTAQETEWVADAFTKRGLESLRLTRGSATEANVRREIGARRYVHLACHGFADGSFGNFFGALVLTPGQMADGGTFDDGYLRLAEIYELDLHGCELAILSACQTNYGPRQQGEGVWSLSRGFLVAGAERVVASNWLVDDEAAASLVAYFCSGVAESQAAGGLTDHAKALHAAKRWVRSQAKWSNPYYWGTFVLIGPQ